MERERNRGTHQSVQKADQKGPQKVQPAVNPAASVVNSIAVYSHMRVEVTSQEGQLLFVAKLMNLQGNRAELHQYSDVGFTPGDEPVPVHIRGYHDHLRKAVYMEGLISPLPHHIWQVENLSVARVGNDRAFFRLDTNLDASITKFGSMGAGPQPCKLLNISVGGARISSPQRFWEGDKFLLTVALFDEREPSLMFCQVLRVVEKEGEPYEYGCQFLEVTEADEGKITQNIFAIQRKMRGGSK